MLPCIEETALGVGKLLFIPDLDFPVEIYLTPISKSLLVTGLRSTTVH